MAFDIGDKVIYPNHGLGVIERIETKTIMGTTCGFYQLRMANETTVFVPVDNVVGTPSISLPSTSTTPDGLPVGVMFSARPGAERTLLELAFALEADRPFRRLQDV